MIRFRNYGLYFLFWTTIGLFAVAQNYNQARSVNIPILWHEGLVTWMTAVYVVASAVPAVLWLGCRFPFARRYWVRWLALHLAASTIWTVGVLAAAAVVLPYLGVSSTLVPTHFYRAFIYLLATGFQADFFLYWTVLAVQAGFRYYRRSREQELHTAELKTRLAHAQLSALKMQLHPHFLFNTLNAIIVLVRQHKGKQAEEVLVRFSDLLRCVLDDMSAQEVPLRREVEYLRLYLEIEEVRFQDRLRVQVSIDPSVLDALVPQMGLQPIVENAIRHGIGRSSAAGKIQIIARQAGECVEIQVSDDGPGFPAQAVHEDGLGLANTRARLEQLYGAAGRLCCENAATGGAIVTVSLPYHCSPDRAEELLHAECTTRGLVSAFTGR